mgnify:FL=1
MFCYKCGTKLDDNATSCYTCGASQVANNTSTNSADDQTYGAFNGSVPRGQTTPTWNPQPAKPPKKKNTGLVIGLIIGGVVALLLIVLFIGGLSDNGNDVPNSPGVYQTNHDQEILAAIQQAKERAAEAKFDQAVTVLDDAQQLYGSDVRIDNQRKAVKVAQHIHNADALLAEKKYDEALAELETAEQLYGKNDDLTAKKKEIVKAEALDALTALETAENYKEAIEYIDKNLSAYKEDTDILAKRNLYVSKYKTQVITNADAALKTDGYEAAMNIINDALKVIPSDQELTAKQDEYMEYKPVDLFSLNYFNAAENFGFEYNDPQEKTDNEGNAHSKTYEFQHDFRYSNTWVEYKLDKKYNKLSGTFFLDYDWRTTKEEAHFYVYGDGKLLYDGVQTGGKVPFDFDVDITNVDILRIEYKTNIWSSSGFSSAVFAGIFDNVQIAKTN